ncbi:AGAP010775-PA-like protein [Anopheles sinensis]|uniref:AGAP010775-PA-like protein n=1 Tax=Anopheles sinensis TaxID=74873 RepID=A0A084WQR4_ANOSI|nr:AGAP010775-PA-like protein [Anopheles sinensis]
MISVYCEQSAYGGGWIVFQHRFNGEEDFYRNWVDYRDGFGSLDGEFWLGLENLHQLTSSRKHELMIVVIDTRGNYGYAHYDHFVIDDESENFKLKIVGRYEGTARDTLKQRLGDKFTTKDEDNDGWIYGNCAVSWKGAWWYDSCGSSDLNGPYAKSRKQSIAMTWDNFSGRSLTYTRMMIRHVD